MMEFMDVSNEIQESLGKSYNIPNDIDEEDLMGELNLPSAPIEHAIPSYIVKLPSPFNLQFIASFSIQPFIRCLTSAQRCRRSTQHSSLPPQPHFAITILMNRGSQMCRGNHIDEDKSTTTLIMLGYEGVKRRDSQYVMLVWIIFNV
ncbi:unnamed protein product [Lactuca virosa]|uniref:Uncharacterized protein n=1 Tax=Lactuca virosa TaxID=75947 RepID=A0AAU9PIJ1_9ASTR|nr:unnamed protein product [Lactuca virosa]